MILLSLFYCYASVLFSTIGSEGNTLKDLYVRSIEAHSKVWEQEVYDQQELREFNVLQKEYIGDQLPAVIKDYRINYLSEEELKAKKGPFRLIMLSPVDLEQNSIVIRVGDYSVKKRENGELIFTYSAGTECVFKYNCRQNKYIFSKCEKLTL
ncbi:hypothetical protein [Pontibacter pudoricolor]|uniref:hypothetical protein n=1 Tax=Pontibacter pudoricolor TaxID=2694930 RepID=UPI001391D739|nr:hypothetical protein [Pontibacter pudoricolor]